ncbi:S8 family peptidase [Kocuria palustris]|uniref:S8 family peptidase n=1 Tax=Kocuria palustris TaxID=71999 RepID=UPI0023005EFA|nr:S8 family serine peptidase [Kocuria palustris]
MHRTTPSRAPRGGAQTPTPVRSRRRSRAVAALIATSAMALTSSGGLLPAYAAPAAETGEQRQLVLAAEGVSAAQAVAAIEAAGGEVAERNDAIGLFTVNGPADLDQRLESSAAIAGAMDDQVIGYTPDARVDKRRKDTDDVERARADRPAVTEAPDNVRIPPGQAKKQKAPATADDPLRDRQWNLDMIDADQAHRTETGAGVRVGVMDTGVDGTHPDIAPNLNYELSRNFTTDIPEIDGACEDEVDGSCQDGPTVDEGGHGTHVASTIASPVNGLGIEGVAPEAEIVNLRVGQDSGYFFLESTLEALTYAPSVGIDVVNMSYYIDPWAFNCTDNPADSPEEQQAQQLTIEATNRALNYAQDHGVTLLAAMGNSHMDLGDPQVDTSSPNLPEGAARERMIDNSCLDMPTEGDGVLSISAVGPSGIKSDYSNYGTEQTTVAAPGGYFRDYDGTDQGRQPGNLILAAVPAQVVREMGILDENGESTDPFIVSECDAAGQCAYYEHMQGTSMAAPHATGVAALIIGSHGQPDRQLGGMKMQPNRVEKLLVSSAHEKACDAPEVSYPGRDDSYTAACEGTAEFNGFYGAGIVNAASAVSRTPHKH